MKKLNSLLFPGLLILSGLASAQTGPFGYAVTSTGQFGVIDLGSGAFRYGTCIPVACNASAPGGGGIGYGPNGTLYLYDYPSQNLYRVSPVTAVATLIGNVGVSFTVFAGLGDGRLFGIDYTQDLFQVDPTTGAAKRIAPLFPGSPDGFIATSLSGDGTNLYFSYDAPDFAEMPHPSTLYRINPNTGVIAQIGLTGSDQIGGSAFIGGVLYGFRFAAMQDDNGNFTFNSDSLSRFDTSTGAATPLGTYNVGGLPIYGAVEVRTLAVASPKNITVLARQIQLDGTQSISADGKPLKYQWSIPPGNLTAAILKGDTATPSVQFANGRGPYNFLLTVTDSTGKTATDVVTVNYAGY
jgi:hypothetical protein